MGRTNLTIKAWMLPLVVLALVLPGSAAFILAGPGLGLAVGALAATSVLVFAATRRPDEPIEVARASDRRRRLLLVAIEPVDAPAAVEAVQAAASAGGDGDAEVLVLAPALNTPLSHWASDLGRSRLDAQRKLVLTLGSLAAADVEARGAVGDPDPEQAIEDTLRQFAADEVIVGIPEGESKRDIRALIAELRRRLDVPVYPLPATSPLRSGR
jgi:ABC-type sugar transport system substrate-binding protein